MMTMYLLLLHEIPHATEASLTTFKAAYGRGFQKAFIKLKQAKKQGDEVSLDVALVCNSVPKIRTQPRGEIFPRIQLLLNLVYTLIAATLAEQDQTIFSNSDPNIRVFVVYLGDDTKVGSDQFLDEQGPLLPFKTLASSPWPWTEVLVSTKEARRDLLPALLSARKSQGLSTNLKIFQEHEPEGGETAPKASLSPSTTHMSSETSDVQRRHFSVAVGGTFDHLHLGHKLLLTATALILDPSQDHPSDQSRVLTIGITTTSLLLKKAYASVLESWSQREAAVISFLASILYISKSSSPSDTQRQVFDKDPQHGTAIHYHFPGNLTVRCVEIDDAYGPTITDENIDALVVSAETRKGGEAVNTKRREKGWHELDVYEVGVLDAGPDDSDNKPDSRPPSEEQDFKSKISSTEIRKRLVENAQQNLTTSVQDFETTTEDIQ